MKQTLLLISLWTCFFVHAMENPTAPISSATPASSTSMISPEKFIEYMHSACTFANHHNTVQFCSYSLRWAVQAENNQVFDAALYYWNQYKKQSIEDFTRAELACPFVTAASMGYWYGAQKLLERSKGVIINDSCQVPTHFTVARNSTVVSCVAAETSALAIAAKNGHSQVITNLLEYKSDTQLNVEVVGKNKKNPLMEAIEHDKLACTQALLQGKLKKANPNLLTPDKSFGSILHWALSLGNRNTHVKLLVEHGADVNLINAKNNPQEGAPLMVAVAHANSEGVKILLDAKAKTDLKHPFNTMTAKELAEMKIQIEQDPEKKKIRQNILSILTQVELGNAVTPGA